MLSMLDLPYKEIYQSRKELSLNCVLLRRYPDSTGCLNNGKASVLENCLEHVGNEEMKYFATFTSVRQHAIVINVWICHLQHEILPVFWSSDHIMASVSCFVAACLRVNGVLNKWLPGANI